MPSENSVKEARPIPLLKSELVHEIQRPSFLRRLKQYLEDMLEDYVVHPVLTIWRFGVLMVIFMPLILTVPAVFIGKRKADRDDERSGTLWWYSLLVRHMEMAGPTFIKVKKKKKKDYSGNLNIRTWWVKWWTVVLTACTYFYFNFFVHKLSQWAASRADIFPKQLCIMLSKLHNQVDPHSIEHTRRTIEAAFGGRKMEDIFDEFIETPLGIGAIAQVYRGRLKPGIALHFEPDESTETKASQPSDLMRKLGGSTKRKKEKKKLKTEVAIKVLHPKVARTVARDLAIMKFFASLIHRIPNMNWIALPDQVAMFGSMMEEQLDLRIEARNLVTFQRNFRDRYTVTFPTPLSEFATREMLIEEYVDALPLKAYLEQGAGPFDLKIADIGLDGFLVCEDGSQKWLPFLWMSDIIIQSDFLIYFLFSPLFFLANVNFRQLCACGLAPGQYFCPLLQPIRQQPFQTGCSPVQGRGRQDHVQHGRGDHATASGA